MRTEYSNNDLKVHYELLEKVNSELPDVVIGAMLEEKVINITPTECVIRVMGRTLRILEKIPESDYLEMSIENADKTLDIISKVDENLVLVLKFNIIDMLASKEFSMYTIAVHTVLDILYYLSYITQDEFDKAYNAGGKDGE